mmetsp:Transcript_9132/g.14065  ORF Transcript_9132/g.14065 Transcript_9132/m.14065 type:complete len:396 (+) Transcript_9132:96-1283(+)
MNDAEPPLYVETLAAASLVPVSVRIRLALSGCGIGLPRLVELILLIGAPVCALSGLFECWVLAVIQLIILFFIVCQMKETNLPAESVRAFRTATSLATAVAILAVDFSAVCPPRFAKTGPTLSGISLMDLGTGAVIFGDSLIPHRKSKPRRIIFLLFLGALRYTALRLTGLPEPEPEYQLGWNFFFTLGAIEFFVVTFTSKLLFFITTILFVLFDQNLPPGLNTLPGYLTIHTAVILCRTLHSQQALFLAALLFCLANPSQASRATVNFDYVAFILAICFVFLHLAPKADSAWYLLPSNSILHCINSNLLSFFIFANLICGSCNLLLDTSRVTSRCTVILVLFIHSALSFLMVIFVTPVLPSIPNDNKEKAKQVYTPRMGRSPHHKDKKKETERS